MVLVGRLELRVGVATEREGPSGIQRPLRLSVEILNGIEPVRRHGREDELGRSVRDWEIRERPDPGRD